MARPAAAGCASSPTALVRRPAHCAPCHDAVPPTPRLNSGNPCALGPLTARPLAGPSPPIVDPPFADELRFPEALFRQNEANQAALGLAERAAGAAAGAAPPASPAAEAAAAAGAHVAAAAAPAAAADHGGSAAGRPASRSSPITVMPAGAFAGLAAPGLDPAGQLAFLQHAGPGAAAAPGAASPLQAQPLPAGLPLASQLRPPLPLWVHVPGEPGAVMQQGLFQQHAMASAAIDAPQLQLQLQLAARAPAAPQHRPPAALAFQPPMPPASAAQAAGHDAAPLLQHLQAHHLAEHFRRAVSLQQQDRGPPGAAAVADAAVMAVAALQQHEERQQQQHHQHQHQHQQQQLHEQRQRQQQQHQQQEYHQQQQQQAMLWPPPASAPLMFERSGSLAEAVAGLASPSAAAAPLAAGGASPTAVAPPSSMALLLALAPAADRPPPPLPQLGALPQLPEGLQQLLGLPPSTPR
jgi:hypothetical protein